MASWSELLSAFQAHVQNDPNWLDGVVLRAKRRGQKEK